jgi:N-acylglucosamine-6-phosphate 2-epimerase
MIEQLKHKLVVSCQAWPGTPFYGDSRLMRAMAECALMAGAGGIRANGPDDIREIKKTVPLPMIGIWKALDKRGVRIITPDFASAERLADAGADIIALDATFEARPAEEELRELVGRIKSELKLAVMADISNAEEALRAERCGADLAATTMAGYTPYTVKTEGPDLDLIGTLVRTLTIPVVGEGRFSKPEEVREAIHQRGAHSVVVGTSITAPWEVAARFVRAI